MYLLQVIHLLRFSFTGGDYVKNDIPVRFDPENLDMAAFLHSAADRHANSSYRLYSVTVFCFYGSVILLFRIIEVG